MDKRVLIVEDDTGSSDALCRLLSRRRITTECADSFAEAIAWSREHRFDAAVVDLNLPDSEPMETIARMSEVHPTRAIAFTGVDDPAIIRECQRRNIRFILKGTSSSGILREILLIMEYNEPSQEIERALIDEARIGRKNWTPWYQRLAPVVSVILALITASFVGGASLFNTISERAVQAQQTREHFVKLDEAVSLMKNEIEQGKIERRDLQMKAQISIDDRSNLKASQENLRTEILRRLERIEDKVTGGRSGDR